MEGIIKIIIYAVAILAVCPAPLFPIILFVFYLYSIISRASVFLLISPLLVILLITSIKLVALQSKIVKRLKEIGSDKWKDFVPTFGLIYRTLPAFMRLAKHFTKQHITDSSINLPSEALHYDVSIIEDTDAILGLYSAGSGTAG